jgi:hypothetical protein
MNHRKPHYPPILSISMCCKSLSLTENFQDSYYNFTESLFVLWQVLMSIGIHAYQCSSVRIRHSYRQYTYPL